MKRTSGLLLHITSLPSAYGIGDMGPEAFLFANYLEQTKQSLWQILPLNPTKTIFGNSPYSSPSAFACNPLLISPENLVREGYLQDPGHCPEFPAGRVDFEMVTNYKEPLFDKAYKTFSKNHNKSDFNHFCEKNRYWLEDYALFAALKEKYNQSDFRQWPVELRDRYPEALRQAAKQLNAEMEKIMFLQFVFDLQWKELKHYCNHKGIRIIGDIPIYVSADSADVWANPHIFKLNEDKYPYVVAGVPPDYFSSTGQLWGNPVYNWDRLKEENYDWWAKRMQRSLALYDVVRIDHFRGFAQYWEVEAGKPNAIEGQWADGPGIDLFKTLERHFPSLPVIAEDLGFVTADVRELIRECGFPGMNILMFSFDETMPHNPYVPHNAKINSVMYTGTHDNNTSKGWYEREANCDDIVRLDKYLGKKTDAQTVHWDMVRLAMMCGAQTTIIPVQDILGLGQECRMNLPATGTGNWAWQLEPNYFPYQIIEDLAEITAIYARD